MARWHQDPERISAQNAVHRAVKRGVLVRPQFCEMCGCGDTKLHGHHPNYAEQLRVVWLCPKCHKKLHGLKHFSAKLSVQNPEL